MKASQPVFIPDFTETCANACWSLTGTHGNRKQTFKQPQDDASGSNYRRRSWNTEPGMLKCTQTKPFFWSWWKQKYWFALRVFTSAVHSVMKCMAVKARQQREENLGLRCLCWRHHGMKCQQVAPVLQGTGPPARWCAATPTKTNEVFDVLVGKKIQFRH